MRQNRYLMTISYGLDVAVLSIPPDKQDSPPSKENGESPISNGTYLSRIQERTPNELLHFIRQFETIALLLIHTLEGKT